MVQRRYRLWNHVLAWSLVCAAVGWFLWPFERLPWRAVEYAHGQETGYPEFNFAGYRYRTDSWLELRGSTARYYCHAHLRTADCVTAATGGSVFKMNDRVQIAYLEDLVSGDRYIIRISGRAMVTRCEPVKMSAWQVLGWKRANCETRLISASLPVERSTPRRRAPPPDRRRG